MPALRPCLGCGALSRGSRCPRHMIAGWSAKPSPSSRNRPSAAARRRILKRDRVCRICDLPPTPEDPFEVAHVIAVADGGTHEDANLCGVHASCHAQSHRRRC
jgi:HNH endonuclease